MITGIGNLNPNCLPCFLITWPTVSCPFRVLTAVINHIHFQTLPFITEEYYARYQASPGSR